MKCESYEKKIVGRVYFTADDVTLCGKCAKELAAKLENAKLESAT